MLTMSLGDSIPTLEKEDPDGTLAAGAEATISVDREGWLQVEMGRGYEGAASAKETALEGAERLS